MELTTIAAFAVALGMTATKVLDKMWPTKADAHLEAIAGTTKEMLKVQQSMLTESAVDRERLGQVLRTLERMDGRFDAMETKFERHSNDEDRLHSAIVGHLARIQGGVST